MVAAGERGTDLAVQLGYASVPHTLVHNTIDAITSCPQGTSRWWRTTRHSCS